MISLKLTTVGNSTGVILPKEALAKLNVNKGDQLFLTEAPGGFLITPYSPEFAADMKLAEQLMDQYKDALRELAK